MDSRKSIKFTILMGIVGFCIYLLLDYFEIGTLLHVDLSTFNIDLLGILVNALVVIILFIVTLEYVDKKNISRFVNQEHVARELLIDSFQECFRVMEIMDDENLYKKITEKINPDEIIPSDSAYRKFEDIPFENEMILMDFFKDGVLTLDELSNYRLSKKLYRQFMTTKLIFPDAPHLVEDARKKAVNQLEKSIKAVEEKLCQTLM